MEYFSEEKLDNMLEKFYGSDRSIIHEKYRKIIGLEETEKENNLWKCTVCGYLYDPVNGEPSYDLEPDVPFEDLPGDWVCPVCYAPKSKFEKSKNFELNNFKIFCG